MPRWNRGTCGPACRGVETTMSTRKITPDNLSDKELLWLQTQRGLACELVNKFSNQVPSEHPTIEQLHLAYDIYLEHFLKPPRKGLLRKKSLIIDPNAFVLSVGVAFGDCIAAKTVLEWKIVTDQYGTDMMLFAPGIAGKYTDIVNAPISMIAKRIESRESDWLAPTFDSLINQLNEMSGKNVSDDT